MRSLRALTQLSAAIGLCMTALTPAHAGEFLIGTGLYDITGPVAEIGMTGYAASQEVDGLHQRLRARAFIVQDPATSRRVVFVSADLGALYQSVKLEVVKRLQARFGTTYTHDNVMLSATHTHVGGAAGSHYPLYILAALDKSPFGYNGQGFNAIVDGIVAAIERAHHNLAPGSVDLVEGELLGASINRSLVPYRANADYNAAAPDTNKTMTVLKFRKDNGKEVGLINWFAVHPTSLSLKYTKVSGDNKGYAAQFFERDKGSRYADPETFVAAFANSDEGDVVPADGNSYSAPGFQGTADELHNAEVAGQKQLNKARELYAQPGQRLTGSVDVRHQWVGMRGLPVAAVFTGQGAQRLCKPGRGYSFAAGGENGPTYLSGFFEGMTTSNAGARNLFTSGPVGSAMLVVGAGLNLVSDDPCQWPKPNLVPTGDLHWVPEVLPFQIMTIGSMAIVGVPYEVTTTAGRRIRAQVLNNLSPLGVRSVVIAGLSNTYAGYLTTFEEYQQQHYEGASNEFGPHSLAATQQILSGLSAALVQKTPVPSTATPPDKSREVRLERPGVAWDGKFLNESFGQVLSDAAASYPRGSAVTVAFRGGHPKNNLRTQSTFLTVEKKVGTAWTVVANDWDWETTYQWRREGADRSRIEVTWRIPASTTPGTYRINHFGEWKNGLGGAITSYKGTSREFVVLGN